MGGRGGEIGVQGTAESGIDQGLSLGEWWVLGRGWRSPGEDGKPQEGMENHRRLWRTPGKDGEVLEKMDNPIRGWISPREDGEPQGRMEKPREG